MCSYLQGANIGLVQSLLHGSQNRMIFGWCGFPASMSCIKATAHTHYIYMVVYTQSDLLKESKCRNSIQATLGCTLLWYAYTRGWPQTMWCPHGRKAEMVAVQPIHHASKVSMPVAWTIFEMWLHWHRACLEMCTTEPCIVSFDSDTSSKIFYTCEDGKQVSILMHCFHCILCQHLKYLNK